MFSSFVENENLIPKKTDLSGAKKEKKSHKKEKVRKREMFLLDKDESS